mmetsp:Transcript_5346/g.5854  ORF Transcript_5346/g.5854 Transcript_5346/m.5854 type:complete len:339 (+) Transcript_5346:88-1104(+)
MTARLCLVTMVFLLVYVGHGFRQSSVYRFRRLQLDRVRTLKDVATPTKTSPAQESLNPANPVFVYPGLRSEMFSHELDTQAIQLLSRIPFIQTIARNLFKTIESALVVENLSSAILVGPKQMPKLYERLKEACAILDMKTIPDVYVKQNPIPNAYTLAFQGKRPFIVVHTGLLDLMNEKEVMAVLGHELGHLKCEHGIWVTIISLMVQLGDSVLGSLLPIRNLLYLWQRSAEYSCDRASLLVARDHKVVASVLMKLCGGSVKNNFSKEMNVDAFLDQAKELESERKSLTGNLYLLASEQVSTHPIPLLRAVELVKWSRSPQYLGLMKRAVPKTVQVSE